MTGQMTYALAFEQTEADELFFRKRAARRLLVHFDKRITKGIPVAAWLLPLLLLYFAADIWALPAIVLPIAGAFFLLGYFSLYLAMSLASGRIGLTSAN